jgi:hypothetical protein
MDTSLQESIAATGSCPFISEHPGPARLGADDMLVLPMHKRIFVQYATNEDGGLELRLFYDTKEISFDEPELFAFGETLAKQSRFRAGAATAWGDGYAWTKLQELFEQLIEEGILARAEDDVAGGPPPIDRARTSLLPPATCTRPRTWTESEEITRELTGRAVELGHLELFIPIFRVAHFAMDSDGRQVGEANVFPRALRLEAPTEWMTCIYPGTRYMADAPMNVTALKTMREHWPQMMAALHRIRAAFLRRFPDARDGWTVGQLERLSMAVLAVPTYQLMRLDRPVANGDLHPALSSLFRVTDGLRMTMHHMLFIPFGEPTMSPLDPISSDRIMDYAERNFSFFSGTGVCAGPKHMVQQFMSVLVDGSDADKYASFVFDPAVEAALSDVEAAIDYALLGLQAYAVTFSLWPLMTRTYDQLAGIAEAAVGDGAMGFSVFRDRMDVHLRNLKNSPFLAVEAWRADREHVYADMYQQCGRGVVQHRAAANLHDLIAPVRSPDHAVVEDQLRKILQRRLRCEDPGHPHLEMLLACLMDYAVRTQAILREASATQACINRLLGRAAPVRPFGSADMDVHNLLQGTESRRLPYLLDELEAGLGIHFDIDMQRVQLTERQDDLALST